MSKYTVKPPRIGEVLEHTRWYLGDIGRREAKADIEAVFANTESEFGLIFGPRTWEDISLDEDRLADPPGPEFRALRCEARVVN
ncbi:MAG TPA: hypothetical protein ENH62_16025 [Marinobacter sp.]|uniref:Uncharacterized protein n=1 Tax=marine sediment metagenome TaxID=412755 RepID=A0A0F9IK12_9ZZZZ|nr:hypothetical protein [Marinobacter sp.]